MWICETKVTDTLFVKWKKQPIFNMSYGATVGASAARPNTWSNLIEFKINFLPLSWINPMTFQSGLLTI